MVLAKNIHAHTLSWNIHVESGVNVRRECENENTTDIRTQLSFGYFGCGVKMCVLKCIHTSTHGNACDDCPIGTLYD